MHRLVRFFWAPMQRQLSHLVYSAAYRLKCSGQVACFEGIRIANSDSKATEFGDTMLASLKLIQETDGRRLARIKRHLDWIWNVGLWYRGACYDPRDRTCTLDFRPFRGVTDVEWLLVYCACTLIHEATHGAIQARGIPYTRELWARIERLCVREESRFIKRLSLTKPGLASKLEVSFDVTQWDKLWRTSALEQLRQLFRRD